VTEETSTGPHWYHWASLSACSVVMLAIGVLEVMQGADPTSRFFAIDTWVVRGLGVALVLCALWLPLRHDRAFLASMLVIGLSIAENLVTYRFEAASPADAATTVAAIAVLLGAPLYVLAELRGVFRDPPRDEPPAAE